MGTATREIGSWACTLVVTYDTATNKVLSVDLPNPTDDPARFCLSLHGVLARDSQSPADATRLLPPQRTLTVDVSKYGLDVRQLTGSLPAGWSIAILPD